MIMMTLMIAFMVARIEDPEETLFVLAGEFQVRIWNIYNQLKNISAPAPHQTKSFCQMIIII